MAIRAKADEAMKLKEGRATSDGDLARAIQEKCLGPGYIGRI